MSPHSLGKLIEWKQLDTIDSLKSLVIVTPHSLGKLIEWKLFSDMP